MTCQQKLLTKDEASFEVAKNLEKIETYIHFKNLAPTFVDTVLDLNKLDKFRHSDVYDIDIINVPPDLRKPAGSWTKFGVKLDN